LEIGDYPTVFRSRFVKKGKKNTCDECNLLIPTVVPHCSIFAIYDGEPESSRVCQRCENIRMKFLEKDGADSCDVPYRGLLESIDNMDLKIS
jgi:hypothetical protein